MRLRRGLQFKLSTLLLVIAALSGGLAVRIQQAARQQQAVKAIHKLGGAVLYETADVAIAGRALPPWSRRLLGRATREPVGYVSFAASRQLSLHPELIPGALAELKHLHGLRRLRLEGLEVADADLDQLATLKSLRVLDLSWTRVTDAGLENIERALPDCHVVR